MKNVIYSHGEKTVTLAASEKIAIATTGKAQLYQVISAVGIPAKKRLVTTVSNQQYVSAAYASGGTFIVDSIGEAPVYYEIGTSPVCQVNYGQVVQAAPNALNATGTLTVAMILGGIVTSTTAAAVTATLDTGTVVEGGSDFAADEGIMWSVINTGASNAITVTASTGHTVVGAGAVAASSSGRFMTRKTAANTFVTYRMS